MVAPVVVPSPGERVRRLEDAVVNLALFTVENQRRRFGRLLMAARPASRSSSSSRSSRPSGRAEPCRIVCSRATRPLILPGQWGQGG